MADRPVVPPKKNELPIKMCTELDHSEYRCNLLDADYFYDCEEEIDNQQNQDYITQPQAPTNRLSDEQSKFNCTFTASSATEFADAVENSEDQNMGSESKSLQPSNEEEELSEVLKKLLQYGEEIRACARQCGIDTDSFDCLTPECTGTEPCLEPFVGNSENPEPTAKGDTENDTEENDTQRCTTTSACGLPGDDVWCTPCSSPRCLIRPETPVSDINTIRNLRMGSLEEYFSENSNGLRWSKNSKEDEKQERKAQIPQSSDKTAYRCVKKSKSDSEVLCSSFQEQKSEDEEGYESDSSSTDELDREQSSTEWRTLSCHTVSSLSDENDDRSNSMDGSQGDDAYQDELENRPDASGDGGGSCISIHVTDGDLDEGIYDADVEDHFLIAVESGDQDPLDSVVTYNFNVMGENGMHDNIPPRLTLATEQMLDELFPTIRLQPRPVRILQSLPDHPVSENATGGGEGDFELGRRIVVQSFFAENTSLTQEVTETVPWQSTGFDVGRDSLRGILRWTTVAGFCASIFLIWQIHHTFR